jgi:hypothetical protein
LASFGGVLIHESGEICLLKLVSTAEIDAALKSRAIDEVAYFKDE